MINQRLLEGQAFRNVLKKKINEFKDSQNNIQNVHTPFDLCYDMLNEMMRRTTRSGKDFLVLFNLEFVETLISSFGVPGDRIWFVADGKMEAAFLRLSRYNGVKVEVIDMQKDFVVEEMNPFGGKKFDFVVMNPPYQAPTNRKEDDGGSGTGSSYWHKFVEKALSILKDGGHLCTVHPPLWRKPESKIGSVISSHDLLYLEMHGETDGRKTFGCGTRYDWYILRKSSEGVTTPIICEDGSSEELDIKGMPFIPNKNLSFVLSLMAKQDEPTCGIIYDSSAYETRKPWMSEIQDETFKHPCVHSTTQKGIRWMYSSRNDKGLFGVSKVIFGEGGGHGINNPVIDMAGEYGMTHHALGIKVDSLEEAEMIVKAMTSEKFAEFLASTLYGNFGIEWRTFKYLRKNFWREFI